MITRYKKTRKYYCTEKKDYVKTADVIAAMILNPALVVRNEEGTDVTHEVVARFMYDRAMSGSIPMESLRGFL